MGEEVATARQYDEYTVKAVSLEKFARYVFWPQLDDENTEDSDFEIGVLGENPFDSKLEIVYSKLTIIGRTVKINYFESLNDYSDLQSCHLIFVSSSMRHSIKEVMEVLEGKPILTIGDTAGYLERGVHINLSLQDNKIAYEINKSSLDESGLRMNFRLLNSAKRVYVKEE